MSKTKSKPVTKKSPKGNASKQSKKKTASSSPQLKDQRAAVAEGNTVAPLPSKTTRKQAKAPEPESAPHAVTPETTPTVVLPDATLREATTPIEGASDVAPAPVVGTSAQGTSEETGSEASPAGAPSGSEPAGSGMPPVGTVLRKCDRRGVLRCEATVVEGGVQYAGKVYKSLSAAAIAAAKDLGLTSKAMNGRTWFGLSKPARAASHADPTFGLQRSFDRYVAHLGALLEKTKAGENREPVLARLQRHARVLQNLHDEEVA